VSPQWDLVNTIRCSGETLLTLITDILDFSRIEANKMVLSCAEYRLQSVIEAAMEIAGLHAAQKRLHVAYNVGQSGERRCRPRLLPPLA
jgi:signal transduction histidine kinase